MNGNSIRVVVGIYVVLRADVTGGGLIINTERGRAVFPLEAGPGWLFLPLRARRSLRLDPGSYTYR